MPLKAAASMRQSASGFKSGCTNCNQWTGAGKIYKTMDLPTTQWGGSTCNRKFSLDIHWWNEFHALHLSNIIKSYEHQHFHSVFGTLHHQQATKLVGRKVRGLLHQTSQLANLLLAGTWKSGNFKGQSLSENRLACPQNGYLYLFMYKEYYRILKNMIEY
jgi:hypothetical protein